jgi:hypothetical protein
MRPSDRVHPRQDEINRKRTEDALRDDSENDGGRNFAAYSPRPAADGRLASDTAG